MENYQFFPKVVLRSPILPINNIYKDFFNPNDLDKTEILKKYYALPEVREALFLASPRLFEKYITWSNGKEEDPKEELKLRMALSRYLLRMHSRCTPFGLFAGFTVGNWGASTQVCLREKKELKRHTRFDMYYLCNLAQQLSQHPILKHQLLFFPNTAIYEFHEDIRFIEFQSKSDHRLYQITSIDDSPYIQKVLKEAKRGQTLPILAQVLVDEEVSYEDALEFVEDIANSQLLYSELEPAMTGPEFLEQIVHTLEKCKENPNLNSLIGLLETLRIQIKELDRKGIGVQPDSYKKIAQQLEGFGVSHKIEKLFQVDLVKPATKVEIDKSIQQDIAEAIAILNRLRPPLRETNLSRFKEAFLKRYDLREVPLLEVLDPENGIGFLQGMEGFREIPALLEDFVLPTNGEYKEIKWDKRQEFLLSKFLEAKENNAFEVSISEEELEAFPEDWNCLSETFAVMFSLHSRREKNDICLKLVANGSASNFLSRFTHSDAELDDFTRSITKHEQGLYQDPIIAEIIHLPQSRVGNVLLRTQTRSYEIPFLAKSSVEEHYQISLDDLLISVQNQKVVIRSKRLNREIIPKLSTAHNFFANALPIYQFLCELQFQGISSTLNFNWGVLESNFVFLPRVRHKNVILYRAKWQFKKEHIKNIANKPASQLLSAVRVWRREWQMPQHVVLTEFDNELLIDLEDPFSVQIFLKEIKGLSSFTLMEFIFDGDSNVAQDEDGNNYTNEFIATIARTTKIDSFPLYHTNLKSSTLKRHFPLGSEWLYFKFYTGVKTTDKLLVELIRPLIHQFIRQNWIDDWFFIRYQDPDLHLRVRFHLTNNKHLGALLNALYPAIDRWKSEGLLYKIQVDSYEREIERYGNDTMGVSEKWFSHDSSTIVELFNLLEDHPEAYQLKWIFGMMFIDETLKLFEYNIEDKLNLFGYLKASYQANLQADLPFVTKQLNKRYNLHRKIIEQFLFHDDFVSEEKLAMQQLLSKRRAIALPIAQEILQKVRKAKPEKSLNDLMSSYIHMHFNRLFQAMANQHELILYDWIYRYYRSLKARQKVQSSPQSQVGSL